MKNIVKSLIILLSLLSCTAIFADDITSTTSSETTTSSGATNGINNGNTTTKSTVTRSTTTSVNSNDDAIVSAIYARYAKDSALIGTALTVSCKNGIVTLNGSVTAQSQADEAVIVAKSISGVNDVRSSINVKTNPTLNVPVKAPNY